MSGFGLLDFSEPEVSFFGSLSLAAVGAALFCSPRLVAMIAAYALSWNVFLGGPDGLFTTLHFTRLGIAVFVNSAAVAVAFARERRERSMARMTGVALVAQRALLRPLPTKINQTRLAARYVSSAEDALVGGDFYEATVTPFGTRVIVGDVVGRGLEAVDLAALVLGGFREAALSSADLEVLGRRLDAVVATYARGDEYATAIVAQIEDGHVRLVSCGHPAPLMIGGDGAAEFLEIPPTLPLGYGSEPQAITYAMEPGQRLLVYTDGITEAREPTGRFFDLKTEAELALRSRAAEEALDELLERLERHTEDGLDDDVALVLLENIGSPPSR